MTGSARFMTKNDRLSGGRRTAGRRFRQTYGSSALLVTCALGCSGNLGDGERTAVTGPSEQGFGKVVEVLDYGCGNLACHGTPFRNLRLYGDQGRRLDANDVPCGAPTTPAEIEFDYRSIVGLEPEIMSAVVESHGADPERLTLVRKARGTENHKGGVVFHDSTDPKACLAACHGDSLCKAACYGDRCLISWLAGATDTSACNNFLPRTRCNPAE